MVLIFFFKIYNKGNSSGKFKWNIPEKCPFTLNPSYGTIPSNSFLNIKVTFKPNEHSGLLN